MLRTAGCQVDCRDLANTSLPDQDLADDAVWQRLSQRIRDGHYDLVLASPPCRTFSESRRKQPGPPVLRGWEHRYGFPKSRAAELRLKPHHFERLRMDNLLAERTAEACTTMDALRRGWVVEQPFPWADSVSMFDFESFKALREAGAKYVTFDQCQYGALTAKPTRLLYNGVECDSLSRTCNHKPRTIQLGNGRTCFKRHPPTVGKRDRDGSYATAAQAAYPTDLNAALTRCITDTIRSPPTHPP